MPFVISQSLSCSGAPVLLEDAVHLLRRQVLVEGVVHLNGRRPTACAYAFDFLKREQTVASRAFVADSQPLLAMLKKLFSSSQHAGDIGAHLHVKLATRLRAQHRVIADHVADFQFSEIETGSNFGDYFVRQMPYFILGVKQRGNECRPLRRIMREHFREALLELM